MATTPVMTQERPNRTCAPNTAKKNGESEGISMPATLIGLSIIMLTCLLYLYWPVLHKRIAELLAHTLPVLPALACARSFQATQCVRNRECLWRVVRLLPGRSWYRASPTATASGGQIASSRQPRIKFRGCVRGRAAIEKTVVTDTNVQAKRCEGAYRLRALHP